MRHIEVGHPGDPVSDEIVSAYLNDVASRFYGRPATQDELDLAAVDEPWSDLSHDTGLLVVALEHGEAMSCAGVRFVGDGVAELTKVFTLPEFRGRGLSTMLVTHLEGVCRRRGERTLRLDTRSDLVEACALYERLGFEQVPAFNGAAYSDRWYAKEL